MDFNNIFVVKYLIVSDIHANLQAEFGDDGSYDILLFLGDVYDEVLEQSKM